MPDAERYGGTIVKQPDGTDIPTGNSQVPGAAVRLSQPYRADLRAYADRQSGYYFG